MTDPQLHDRLHRAADPIDADPEARLDALHAGARERALRRRASGLAAGLAVALLVSSLIWQMRPGTRHVAASNGSPNGTLAYVRSSDAGDSLGARAFTFGGSDVEVPVALNDVPFVYSPDGTQLAYAQRAGDGTAITIADADGSDAHEVGQGLSAEQIAWGPDGTTMAFVAPEGTGGGGNDVSILDLVTGDVTPLPKLHGGSWGSIAWSPDGAFIALAGEPEAPVGNVAAGTGGLFIAPSDGSAAPTALLTNTNIEFLDWAPDSSRIAYGVHDNADDGDYRWDIGVINADGTGNAQLTDVPGWDKIAVWSPDGQWIAFSSDRGASPAQQQDNANADNTSGRFNGVGVYLMRSDGTDVSLLFPAGDDVVMAPVDWKA